jgi:hypothetical protein
VAEVAEVPAAAAVAAAAEVVESGAATAVAETSAFDLRCLTAIRTAAGDQDGQQQGD